MIKSPLKISDEERHICQKYIDFDRDIDATCKHFNMTKKALNIILDRKRCQTFTNWREIEKDRKSSLDYNYKIYKIKRVIDDFIPDDQSMELDSRKVAVALSAIAESNKMQGHYSAEKILTANVNMDADLEQAKHVMLDLIAKNKRDY